ncbi:MAG TPA: molybdopterin converting factor subunit 1 [bacterium]
MKIKLKFFGQLRELAKLPETEIEVKASATVNDLREIVGEHFPSLREHLKVVSFAVDSEYASRETVLNDGDEVALLPPISGGSSW